jgi:hypothetical protein
VHPDQIVPLQEGHEIACKELVDGDVCRELRPVVFEESHAIVEQRPERVVAKAVVVRLEPIGVQTDRGVGYALALIDLRSGRLSCGELPAPPEPYPSAFLQRSAQANRETTRRRALPGVGDAIGDDDEPAHRASSHDLLSRMAELMMPTML